MHESFDGLLQRKDCTSAWGIACTMHSVPAANKDHCYTIIISKILICSLPSHDFCGFYPATIFSFLQSTAIAKKYLPTARGLKYFEMSCFLYDKKPSRLLFFFYCHGCFGRCKFFVLPKCQPPGLTSGHLKSDNYRIRFSP